VTYAAPSPITVTGSSPRGVAVGLVNADAHLDLLVANSGTGEMGVYLGNGNGTFTPAAVFPPINGVQAVGAADFNGDGKLDAAVVHPVGISIFLGNGDGTFLARADYNSLSGYPGLNLVVADFSSDGKPDVVFGDYYYYVMFTNDGNGAFTRRSQGTASNFGLSVGMAAGDLNNDGKNDLVTGGGAGSCGQNGYFVHLGTGDANGTFSGGGVYGASTSPCGSNAFTIATGHINGDANLDIVLGNTNNNGVLTRTYLGAGTGVFAAAGTLVPTETLSLLLGDVDSDGVLDIINAYNGVMVNVGRGNGTFRPTVQVGPNGSGPPFTFPAPPRALASGDFNGDGKLDLAVADTQETVNILLNTSQ
jgi:hypothetical protein